MVVQREAYANSSDMNVIRNAPEEEMNGESIYGCLGIWRVF